MSIVTILCVLSQYFRPRKFSDRRAAFFSSERIGAMCFLRVSGLQGTGGVAVGEEAGGGGDCTILCDVCIGLECLIVHRSGQTFRLQP